MSLPRLSSDISAERVAPLLAEAERAAQQLEAARNELSADMASERLGALIAHFEEATRALALAGDIAGALFSTDAGNEECRLLVDRVSRVATELETRLLFFTLAIKEWGEERIRSHAQALPRHARWLERLAQYAPHTLSEEEERVIALKDRTGDEVLTKLYELITSQLTYAFRGEEVTLAELMKHLYDPDRSVRREAREARLARLAEHADILGELYRGLAEDWDAETVVLRRHANPLAPRHLANDIPPQAYRALAAAVAKRRPLFTRYIELKRRALGYDEFTQDDFTAPVPGKPAGLPDDEARERILSVFGAFAPWMRAQAERVLRAGRVDAEPRRGKRAGAWCFGMVPGEVPLVLVNWTDSYEDLFSLAHELGHAVHDLLASEHSVLSFSPPLVLAETASTFAEALVLRDALAHADRQERIALLCQRLDEFLGVVPTQLRYTAFEEDAHRLVTLGEPLDAFHARWAELIRTDYPSVAFPDRSVGWLGIPHLFEQPFYCYSYAFGLLLVYALLERAEEEGDAFPEKLRALLAAGGSRAPAELLKALGYDITSEAFWEEGLAAAERDVDALEALLE